jgi:plasmid stabilization system protein ParE
VAASHEVRVTENFVSNLDSIRAYLEEQAGEAAFEALLDWLFDTLIPILEQFPRIGRDFPGREPASAEGTAKREMLISRLAGECEIREYISEDHLALYALKRSTVFLLSIRHHRQLSFDLRGHWSP